MYKNICASNTNTNDIVIEKTNKNLFEHSKISNIFVNTKEKNANNINPSIIRV